MVHLVGRGGAGNVAKRRESVSASTGAGRRCSESSGEERRSSESIRRSGLFDKVKGSIEWR